ncbi:MAG: DUF4263 domain-containing protein [Acidobacteriota bacterium]|nr:DUF4263 domain-containing protein [Acidobacteriota bacterium]
MYQKRQKIEDAIISLKLLLEDDNNDEDKFQKWFENNPIVFSALNYKNYIPHPVFQIEYGESLVPDFLVQRLDNLWEIFELKLPNAKILKDKKTRQTFYAPLSDYLQQCIDYSNYFDDKAHRETFNNSTDVLIETNPRAKLVAGRNDGLERYKVEQRLRERGYRVDLITYDDIITQLEFYKLNNLGNYESVNGICIHLLLTLNNLGLKNKDRNQLIMIGKNLDKDCISLHTDLLGNLCFEIIDSYGTSYISKVTPGSNTFYYNQLMYCIIEFGRDKDYSVTSIEINGKYHSFNVLDKIDITLTSTNLPVVIGSDCFGRSIGSFDLYEHIIFGATLNLEDRIKIRENVFSHYFGRNINKTPRIRFKDNQFLRSNFHPNFPFNNDLKPTDLVQPENTKQPSLFSLATSKKTYVSVFYDQS